jgi:hypothetical protein
MHDNGVLVANISWGISPQEIEDDMQASGAGGPSSSDMQPLRNISR